MIDADLSRVSMHVVYVKQRIVEKGSQVAGVRLQGTLKMRIMKLRDTNGEQWLRLFSSDGINPVRGEITRMRLIYSDVKIRRNQFRPVYLDVARSKLATSWQTDRNNTCAKC